ncbi:MAG: DUF4436 family protein [Mycobacterium sp.]
MRIRRAHLVVAAVGLCAIVSASLYAASGKSRYQELPERVSDGVNVILDLVSINPAQHEITMRIELAPNGSYLNTGDDTFAAPLRLITKSVVEGSVFTDIPAGQPVGNDYKLVFPIDGNPQKYPVDEYNYAYEESRNPKVFVTAPLLKIEKMEGGLARPVPIGLWRNPKGLEGWTEDWTATADGPTLKVKLLMGRSGGVLAFVTIVLLLLIAIANLAILIAWSAYTGRRPVESGFAGWLTALLFALIPLRINLPGAPPIGAWIDAMVFFWIEIAILVALVSFIAAWFRYHDVPDYTELHAAKAARRR